MKTLIYGMCGVLLATMVTTTTLAKDKGDIKLTSAGPIAFGPKGLLLVSDPMEATIYAIETGDTKKPDGKMTVDVENVRAKIAAMLGSEVDDVRINDLAVNPVNGNAYLSVSRGSGDDSNSLILKVVDNEISEFALNDVTFTSTSLANAAESKKTRRGGDQRLDSITDLAFIDDQVYVAGLSNEEFASNLRAINYPFAETSSGSSIEIYHGAHGAFETRSPVRTFAAYEIDNETNLLAAYTCTPLVRIPVTALKPNAKVKGTTIAELGNMNRPLDMVVYKKDGKDFVLMANSSRGMMKIDLAKAADQESIEKRVARGETEGLPYETIKELAGVMQLDGLNETQAVVVIRDESGKEHLKTIDLP